MSIPRGNGCKYLSPGDEATSLSVEEKKEEEEEEEKEKEEGCLKAGERATRVTPLSSGGFFYGVSSSFFILQIFGQGTTHAAAG